MTPTTILITVLGMISCALAGAQIAVTYLKRKG